MKTAIPNQATFFGSTKPLPSVIALTWLSVTLLSGFKSWAEVKTPGHGESSFSAAHCHGSIAKTEWTLADGKSPTPACMEGKDVVHGVLDFDANEDQSAIVPFTLPGQFGGRITVKIMWRAVSTIGSVGWCVELVTGTDLEREGGAPFTQTARNCASDPAKKSAQPLTTVLALNVAPTAAAGNHGAVHIRVSRDANSSVVLDDMPGNARLISVVIETPDASRQTLSRD